jgi:hypothetical protein
MAIVRLGPSAMSRAEGYPVNEDFNVGEDLRLAQLDWEGWSRVAKFLRLRIKQELQSNSDNKEGPEHFEYEADLR